MTFKLAIASGKGGTGKTTVSVNLYHFLNERFNQNVQLIDCDVEEPNDKLFFDDCDGKKYESVFQQIAQIDTSKCSFCKKCVDYCEFNAISVISSVGFAEISPSLCHSCGACLVACPTAAIFETPHEIGTISHFQLTEGLGLAEGRLKIGSTMQTMVIKATKKRANSLSTIVIFDAPPGTSCPVVETISDVNYVILVSEPTPFGLHDLKLMVELLRELNKPFGLVINKAGLGNNDVYSYINDENIELLGEIPFSKTYASSYALGRLIQNVPDNFRSVYHEIVNMISQKMDS